VNDGGRCPVHPEQGAASCPACAARELREFAENGPGNGRFDDEAYVTLHDIADRLERVTAERDELLETQRQRDVVDCELEALHEQAEAERDAWKARFEALDRAHGALWQDYEALKASLSVGNDAGSGKLAVAKEGAKA
jgi:hypothetical protein